MQDLIKGIGKLIPKNNHTVQKATAVSDVDNKIKGLINLINLAIEEKNWDKADNLCEQLMMTQPNSVLYYFFDYFLVAFSFLVPYLLRAFLRSLTPAVSKVPRTI